MKPHNEDPVMGAVREWFKGAGLTLAQLGVLMGYDPSSARQRAYQVLGSDDPAISVVRRLAAAIGMKAGDLVEGLEPPATVGHDRNRGQVMIETCEQVSDADGGQEDSRPAAQEVSADA